MAISAATEETARILRAMDEEFIRNANSGDAEALVSAFYAEDAEVLPPNHPPVGGSAAIRDFWKGMAAARLSFAVLEARRIETSGELAYASGVYDLTLAPPGADTISDNGKYIVVYRRSAEGAWKAIADIFNSNRPAK